MSKPKKRAAKPTMHDRDVAFVLDGQDDDRVGTIANYREEVVKAERERVLAPFERMARIWRQGLQDAPEDFYVTPDALSDLENALDRLRGRK